MRLNSIANINILEGARTWSPLTGVIDLFSRHIFGFITPLFIFDFFAVQVSLYEGFEA